MKKTGFILLLIGGIFAIISGILTSAVWIFSNGKPMYERVPVETLLTVLGPICLIIGIFTCAFIKHYKFGLMFILIGIIPFSFFVGLFLSGYLRLLNLELFITSSLLVTGGILYYQAAKLDNYPAN